MGMFTAALFIIPKHPTTGEWIHCGTSIQSSLPSNRKRKTIDLRKPNMNLKSITLSERSQTQKLLTIHFCEILEKAKLLSPPYGDKADQWLPGARVQEEG